MLSKRPQYKSGRLHDSPAVVATSITAIAWSKKTVDNYQNVHFIGISSEAMFSLLISWQLSVESLRLRGINSNSKVKDFAMQCECVEIMSATINIIYVNIWCLKLGFMFMILNCQTYRIGTSRLVLHFQQMIIVLFWSCNIFYKKYHFQVPNH